MGFGHSILGVVLLGVPALAQLTPPQKQVQLDSFEKVWTTIRDQHWETRPGGLDWDAIHREIRPKMEAVQSADEARNVMREMLARLRQTHFVIIPSVLYRDVAESGGDGVPGFEVRVLEHRVIVVEAHGVAGIRPGIEIASAGGVDLRALVRQLQEDPAMTDLALHRAISSSLSGKPGTSKTLVVSDGSGAVTSIEVPLTEPRGNLAGFGNLPPQHVWFEAKRFTPPPGGGTGEGTAEGIGYIRFNEFLDLVRIMGQFEKAVQECAKCAGLIIDLRGNPGGIGAMAMGMAGFLTEKTGLQLGTMHMRGATLKFVINPRAGAYTGPAAILVDSLSASTSEIFAGGLRDIGRARIFGERTAGAALPSVFTRLPNGDGFQYAVANYISEGGKALEANGVTPDVEVKLTREGLLAGHDAVLEAAMDWIRSRRTTP